MSSAMYIVHWKVLSTGKSKENNLKNEIDSTTSPDWAYQIGLISYVSDHLTKKHSEKNYLKLI